MSTPELEKAIKAARTLATAVIVGYGNEHQEVWPDGAAKQHQCSGCYQWAKNLRDALKDLEAK
jgi:hypothetical protein